MTSWVRCLSVGLVFLLAVGCASLHPGYEAPTVNVDSFRMLPAEGLAPRFEIGLHILNPNGSPLRLKGAVYRIELEGHRILTGVANDLPEIAGYGQGSVTLTASVDVMESILLVGRLMKEPRDTFAYALDARLDPGPWQPDIVVSKTGRISMSP